MDDDDAGQRALGRFRPGGVAVQGLAAGLAVGHLLGVDGLGGLLHRRRARRRLVVLVLLGHALHGGLLVVRPGHGGDEEQEQQG